MLASFDLTGINAFLYFYIIFFIFFYNLMFYRRALISENNNKQYPLCSIDCRAVTFDIFPF